ETLVHTSVSVCRWHRRSARARRAAGNGEGPRPVTDGRIHRVGPVHEYLDLAVVTQMKLTKLVYQNRVAVILDILPDIVPARRILTTQIVEIIVCSCNDRVP